MNYQSLIQTECNAVALMLQQKNARYGNSAIEPLRVFSRATPDEQIRVRIDDKLSRLRTSGEQPDEDTVLDLIGYLILYRVQQRAAKLEAERDRPVFEERHARLIPTPAQAEILRQRAQAIRDGAE